MVDHEHAHTEGPHPGCAECAAANTTSGRGQLATGGPTALYQSVGLRGSPWPSPQGTCRVVVGVAAPAGRRAHDMREVTTEMLVSCALMLGLIYALRWVHLQMMPGLVHRVEHLLRSVRRSSVRALWTTPVRQHGLCRTLWFWSVAGAALTTIGAVSGGVSWLPAAVVAWVIVLTGWWVLRWWARRRYRPRPMPQRRHGRRTRP